MKTVFVDTAFYVTLWNPDDRFHTLALAWARDSSVRLVVTEYVFVEFGNLICRSHARVHFPALVRHVQQDPHTLLVPASADLLSAGLDLYEDRPDKEWSMTDCLSFVVMKEKGIPEALTTDHHFEQAGFTILLK